MPSDTHRLARRGIRLMITRQAALQIITFMGGVVLARVLDPAQFGLYAIATFLVGAFALLGEFGLAPSFIQRREAITELDLRVGFTLQQVFTTAIVAALLLSAPWLASLYPKAPPDTVWLVRAVAFNLYLTSWRSMSALQLERALRYDRLARIEVVETLSYQAIAVGLALAGLGVWSFVWASVARGVLGALLVFLAAPWNVRVAFDRRVAARILTYGLPFQLQSLTNAVGGWITPLFVGSFIGPQAVGYLTWASSNGKKPLVLVDSVMRVAFPHFARIQADPREVERTVVRYLTYLLLPAGLWFVLLFGAGSDVVTLVYTRKWSPAAPALTLYAATLPLDVIAWISATALNAVGHVHHPTRVAGARTLGQILLAIPLIKFAGFDGVPIAMLVASAVTVPWILLGFGRDAATRMLRPLAWLVYPVGCGGAVAFVIRQYASGTAVSALVSVFTLTLFFAATAWLTAPSWLKDVFWLTRGRPWGTADAATGTP